VLKGQEIILGGQMYPWPWYAGPDSYAIFDVILTWRGS